jgi:hypothetical protein
MNQTNQPNQPKQPVRPSGILDPNFKYVPAAATDITQTWRRFGWKPIESKEKHYEGSS